MTDFDFDDDGPDASDAGFLFDDLLDGPAGDTTETSRVPSCRSLRIEARRAMLKMERETKLRDVLGAPPKAGEQVHVVSAAKFDFWTWVPVMLDWLGRADHLYCSTWTLSRGNAKELFALWDAGKIGQVHVLTGTYFKRRESAVYAYLVENLRNRGGRYRAFANHAKVLLLANTKRRQFLSVEGSANLTSNPRLEQNVITNHRGLYDFHRAWMDEMFAAPQRSEDV